MAATLGSTLLGFIREVINAGAYGTQWELDTFLAAATIPTILFGLFNGALVSALVPAFSEYLALGRDAEAWRLGNTIINLLALVLVVAGAIGWVLAPFYVPFIAHGFPAPQMEVAVRMTRWLMPTIVLTSLSGVVAALLNAHHRFLAPALQGVAINLVTIACVVLLVHNIGIYALVLGTTLGFAAQLAVQLPALLSMGRYRFILDLHHPGIAKIFELLGPIVVGSAAGQVALFFDRFFASTLTPGYIAGMNYATKLVGFPQQIFAAAIATVIFPLLASHFARRNRGGVRRAMVTGLRIVNFVTIPAVCGLIVLRQPIVATLFERGNFTPSATQLCASLLSYAAIGLVPLAANVILTRCCFACNETRLPVMISIGAVIANVALSLYWLPTLGAKGLLLANSLSQGVQCVALTLVVWRLLDGIQLRVLARSAGSAVLCSLAMLVVLEWFQTLGVAPAPTFAARAWYLVGQLVIAGAVFFTTARLIKAPELGLVARMVLEKFERKLPSAAESTGAPIA